MVVHKGIEYKPEIDGLRAIAVLAVIIFHAKLGFLPGGFVGVDIFFVISGYLITSIILHEEKQGNFSILNFYERRVRRIFPALFSVVFACLMAGFFLFTPRDFGLLGWASFASMAFFSNLYFAKLDGYFAPSSESQPLLHTWSLGVEEQFYLIAPFIILLIYRRFHQQRALIIALLFLASLAASLYSTQTLSRRTFYMPHIRAFELLIGVALAMELIPKFRRKWMIESEAYLGLLMITASFFIITAQSPFPGSIALLPTIGTGMLIHSLSGSNGLVAQFLSARPMVGIGKISYSLYLWHWPLLAFAEYEFGHSLTSMQRIGFLLVAVALSLLTYLYVEQPARHNRGWFTQNTVFAMGTSVIAFCAATWFVIQRTDGLPQRLSQDAQLIAKAVKFPKRAEECSVGVRQRRGVQPDVCSLGSSEISLPRFILFGDSHAEALSPALNKLVLAQRMKGLNIVHHGCPALVGYEQYSTIFKPCIEVAAAFKKYLNDPQITDVILASRWAYYAEGDASTNGVERIFGRFIIGDSDANRSVFERLLFQTVDQLTTAGKRVTIIGPTPEMPVHIPTVIVKNAMRGLSTDLTIPRATFDERQKNIFVFLKKLEEREGVRVIYPHRTLCNETVCFGSKNRLEYYYDDHHLSDAGAMLFAPEMTDILNRVGKLK
jgi:peptidoglycan/LPS O-acetylase OafA/YrhL